MISSRWRPRVTSIMMMAFGTQTILTEGFVNPSRPIHTGGTLRRRSIVVRNSDNDMDGPDAIEAASITRRRILQSLMAAVVAAPGMAYASDASVVPRKSQQTAWNILKPPLDSRDYSSFTLENGLRVLVCSDPSSNTAAAAMDVHVGATSDPRSVPGLAHFCEHMLFLGTEKYPAEDSFNAFLSTNGGSSNAFTDSEDTVYFFDMNAKANVQDGLNRFGSFFSSPLFSESATGRELNAIESENVKNLQSDIFRMYQIEKTRANPEHPYSKFFTGNKSTLLEETLRQGINLREELVKFYEEHYSANQMYLSVIGPQSVKTLKSYVNKAFSAVPNRNISPPEDAWEETAIYDAKKNTIPSIGYAVEIVPVQELRQVALTWPIALSSQNDKDDRLYTKPEVYLGHLIGHEGPGSLLSYLKSTGWVNGLGSATDAEMSNFQTFEIAIELTTVGLANVDKVCEAIFSYIQMLGENTIPNYIFDEVFNLQELQWRFLSKGEPSRFVTSLVTNMRKYEPSLYIAGPRRLALKESPSTFINSSDARTNFSSEEQRQFAILATQDYVKKLTPQNVMLTLLSKTFQGKTDQKEKWYGTDYAVKPIPALTLSKWSNPSPAKVIGMAFPKPNLFIPSEEGLRMKKKVDREKMVPRTFEEKMKPITAPKLILGGEIKDRWTVHFKQDDRFGEPKAFAIFQLLTSKLYDSPKSALLSSLYALCVQDSLDEYTYDAGLAGLSYDLQILPRGVRLTFSGYNDRLQEFATDVVNKLSARTNELLPQTKDQFERYKDRVSRSLLSFDTKQPYSHAIYYQSLTLKPRNFEYTNAELRVALSTATLDDLLSYATTIWSSGKGEALVQGNLDEKEAIEFVNTVDRALGFETAMTQDYPLRLQALPLPLLEGKDASPTKLSIKESNPSNKNSVSQVIFQSLGKSLKDHVLIEVLSGILEEHFFEELRTKQQLGYIVSSGIKGIEETRTLSLIVQSSVAPAEKLTAEILKFMKSFRRNHLETLTEMQFSLFVKGLVDRKVEPDKNLATEVTRNWSEITTGRLQFDRIQREVGALLELKKIDLLTFWDEVISLEYQPEKGGCRALITEIIPDAGVASSKAPSKSTGYANGEVTGGGNGLILGIDDIEAFRKNREPKSSFIID